MKICPDCNCPIDDIRKRCAECAYKRHKLVTAEQRRQRTTIEHGWGQRYRYCKDCDAPFIVDQRYSSGPGKTRCPECDTKKNGPRPPKPDHPCKDCGQLIGWRSKRCTLCQKIAADAVLEVKRISDRAERESKLVPCSVCGTKVKSGVCTPCGKAARRRQVARLRNFRNRMFTTLVHEPVDVEFILNLLDQPCVYCLSTKDTTIEHKTPLSRGGKHEIENLAASCFKCNSKKQAMTHDEFLELLYGSVQ